MKSRRVCYGIGSLLSVCYLCIEAFIDIRTGRMTNTELFILIVLSIISAVFLAAFVKNRIKK